MRRDAVFDTRTNTFRPYCFVRASEDSTTMTGSIMALTTHGCLPPPPAALRAAAQRRYARSAPPGVAHKMCPNAPCFLLLFPLFSLCLLSFPLPPFASRPPYCNRPSSHPPFLPLRLVLPRLEARILSLSFPPCTRLAMFVTKNVTVLQVLLHFSRFLR